MPYNVYLVDTMDRIGSNARRDGVKAALQPYFDAIAKLAKVDGGALVSFVTANPQPKDYELIVYFCSENWHVVSQLPGAPAIDIEAGGGLTVWNHSVTGSDVAADGKMEPVALANLSGEHVQDVELMMAGSVVTVLPVLLMFIALQRQYISGIMAGSVKG